MTSIAPEGLPLGKAGDTCCACREGILGPAVQTKFPGISIHDCENCGRRYANTEGVSFGSPIELCPHLHMPTLIPWFISYVERPPLRQFGVAFLRAPSFAAAMERAQELLTPEVMRLREGRAATTFIYEIELHDVEIPPGQEGVILPPDEGQQLFQEMLAALRRN